MDFAALAGRMDERISKTKHAMQAGVASMTLRSEHTLDCRKNEKKKNEMASSSVEQEMFSEEETGHQLLVVLDFPLRRRLCESPASSGKLGLLS